MRFYKTSEHAIRAIIYISLNAERNVSVAELHEQLSIPYKYVGRLMPKLARAGLVQVQRGKEGGYRLNKPLKEILVRDIIEAVEGLDNYTRCILGFPKCSDQNPCPVHKYWGPIRDRILTDFLDRNLEDLTNQEIKKI